MSKYIGIALNDDYTSMCIDGGEDVRTVPTVVCKEKKKDAWHVGEEAYKLTLAGKGIMVDKLLSLLRKEGNATVEGTCYTAVDVLSLFFKELLKGQEDAACIVVSIRKPERGLMRMICMALELAGVPGEKIQLISHTESFVHFVLAQDKNLYNQQVGMFELSNQCLYYYEMKTSRGSRKLVAADSQAQEEAFNLDILNTPSGEKIADKILSSMAERILEKKTFSSIFLCGKGFERIDYANDFMARICNRRRVCIEPQLFAIGAAIQAGVLCKEREAAEYTIICDTRVTSNVGIKVTIQEKETVLPLVQAGDPWFHSVGRVEAILDNQDYVELVVSPVDQLRRMNVRLTLENFPKRANRTTKVLLTTKFTDAGHMQISVKDKGFGDLFPATDAFIREEIEL